jgi:[ribosomal protein S5]-alanine N-acetyltransferase
VTGPRLRAERLGLLPLDPRAAAALPDDRALAARVIGAQLAVNWPARDLLDVLPMQAAASPENACFGVWVIIERLTGIVVGDIGFFGPPGPDHVVEVGYSVVPDRRRRGYATEAASTLIAWALGQPGISVVVAGCDSTNLPSVRTLEGLGFSRVDPVGEQLRWRLHPGS